MFTLTSNQAKKLYTEFSIFSYFLYYSKMYIKFSILTIFMHCSALDIFTLLYHHPIQKFMYPAKL